MNFTLDGLERVLTQNPKFKKTTRAGQSAKVNLVRFADDIIVTASSKELLEDEVKPLIEEFLKIRGLEFSPEKTRIIQISEGFDFLGQHIRKYRQGNLLIHPSSKSLTSLLRRVREVIRDHPQVTPGALIWLLNPILRGWANYHQHVASKQTFHKVDRLIFRALWRWSCRRHPQIAPMDQEKILQNHWQSSLGLQRGNANTRTNTSSQTLLPGQNTHSQAH